MPSEAAKPRLIVDDTRVCWLFPDGSHRGVTKGDADQITTLLNGWLYSGAMTGDQLDKLRADTEKVLQNVE